MLKALPHHSEDKIIAVMAAFQADPRPQKLDLGVGVYKDASGAVPIFRAVKAAEAVNQAEETTKVYNRFIGYDRFLNAATDLALGPKPAAGRRVASQTPGGTGAVHALFDLARMANPDLTVWLTEPTWPNHPAILQHRGIAHRSVAYLDDQGRADIPAFLAGLNGVRPGDVVLLHGCCHNPSGADPDAEGWAALAAHAEAHGWVPMIDLAYHGLGDGLKEDAAGVRFLVERLPEVFVAVSFSKTFGLYRDRVGLALVTAPSAALADRTGQTLTTINRLTYSFAPHPGAAIVARILEEPGLRSDWARELEDMRTRMQHLRLRFAEALRRETNSNRFDTLLHQRGMFSRLPLDLTAIERLRSEQAIYIVDDGRINVAGLTEVSIPGAAASIAKEMRP